MQLDQLLAHSTGERFVTAGSLLGGRGGRGPQAASPCLCVTARPGPVPKTRSSSSPAFLSASHRPLAGAQHLVVVVLVEASGVRGWQRAFSAPGCRSPGQCSEAQRPWVCPRLGPWGGVGGVGRDTEL